ncbi:uncharacterized protein LOC105698011 [Orussus abietinus]|uniref:uncharacterized protein LOC105698011 n=1 Tax=Orussus abietinus TaxID=222816 RepID=UPI0006250EA3|nr:uncharacterized protein LOC105698011 [Orussus abietinus]
MNSENTEDEPPNTSAVEKALETYLRAENDKLKQKLFEKKNKVEELKETVRNGLIRRKELKKKIEEESQKQTDLGTTLASLEIYNRQLTDQIMLRKANVGSDVVLWHLSHVNEYGAIVNMYREKWAQYEVHIFEINNGYIVILKKCRCLPFTFGSIT